MCPNVIPLIGNHEYMALSVLRKLMLEITEENYDTVLDEEFLKEYQLWMGDGGRVTLEQFKKISRDDRRFLIEYLEEFELYEEIFAMGKDIFLYMQISQGKINSVIRIYME